MLEGSPHDYFCTWMPQRCHVFGNASVLPLWKMTLFEDWPPITGIKLHSSSQIVPPSSLVSILNADQLLFNLAHVWQVLYGLRCDFSSLPFCLCDFLYIADQYHQNLQISQISSNSDGPQLPAIQLGEGYCSPPMMDVTPAAVQSRACGMLPVARGWIVHHCSSHVPLGVLITKCGLLGFASKVQILGWEKTHPSVVSCHDFFVGWNFSNARDVWVCQRYRAVSGFLPPCVGNHKLALW